MRIFNISKGVPGFWKLYDYGYQYTHMITTEAQERMRILIFWKTHGLKATQDAFKVSRSTLFAWQSAFHAGAKKITALNPTPGNTTGERHAFVGPPETNRLGRTSTNKTRSKPKRVPSWGLFLFSTKNYPLQANIFTLLTTK